jgi:hypothetical protein
MHPCELAMETHVCVLSHENATLVQTELRRFKLSRHVACSRIALHVSRQQNHYSSTLVDGGHVNDVGETRLALLE